MADTVRVGLIGFGHAGRVFHAPQITAIAGMELAAIASSREDEIHTAYPKAKVYADADSLLTDDSLDLVVIATPNEAHAPLAIAALNAGKAVVVDKPFTVTCEEARAVMATAQETGKLLSVFHNRRWDSDYLTLKAEVASGRLGKIVYFESHFDRYRPVPSGNWREQAVPAAGLWYDLGPHLIDQAVALFGRPQSIFADMEIQRDGVAATDYFHVILRYGKTRVVLMASALAAADDQRFVLHGTRASLTISGADAAEAAKRPQKKVGTEAIRAEADGALTPVPLLADDRQAFYAGMRDAVLGHAPLPVTADEAFTVMQVLAIAQKSVAESREVPFA
ncbi:MAG: oxidoreductase [Rhizomicrobium sp.]